MQHTAQVHRALAVEPFPEFTMITDTMPRPYGAIAVNLAQCAEWTDKFFHSAFARPDFVGWHDFCWLAWLRPDRCLATRPRKQDRQHSGLPDGFGNPYPELQRVLKAASSELYDIATSKA